MEEEEDGSAIGVDLSGSNVRITLAGVSISRDLQPPMTGRSDGTATSSPRSRHSRFRDRSDGGVSPSPSRKHSSHQMDVSWEAPPLDMWPKPPPAPPAMAASRRAAAARDTRYTDAQQGASHGGTKEDQGAWSEGPTSGPAHSSVQYAAPVAEQDERDGELAVLGTGAAGWHRPASMPFTGRRTGAGSVYMTSASNGRASPMQRTAAQPRKPVFRRVGASERLVTAPSTADFRPAEPHRPRHPVTRHTREDSDGLELLASVAEPGAGSYHGVTSDDFLADPAHHGSPRRGTMDADDNERSMGFGPAAQGMARHQPKMSGDSVGMGALGASGLSFRSQFDHLRSIAAPEGPRVHPTAAHHANAVHGGARRQPVASRWA